MANDKPKTAPADGKRPPVSIEKLEKGADHGKVKTR